LNLLENHFQMLLGGLLAQLQQSAEEVRTLDHLIDSMPLILAQGSISKRAKVARQIAGVGFCASKQMHFTRRAAASDCQPSAEPTAAPDASLARAGEHARLDRPAEKRGNPAPHQPVWR